MEKFLAIALGGALGAILRVYVSEGVMHKIGLAFPYGTMVVNLIGCLLIGLCLGAYILRPDWPEWIRFLLVAGGLGAFTTFSTFAFELLDLLLCDGCIIEATICDRQYGEFWIWLWH